MTTDLTRNPGSALYAGAGRVILPLGHRLTHSESIAFMRELHFPLELLFESAIFQHDEQILAYTVETYEQYLEAACLADQPSLMAYPWLVHGELVRQWRRYIQDINEYIRQHTLMIEVTEYSIERQFCLVEHQHLP